MKEDSRSITDILVSVGLAGLGEDASLDAVKAALEQLYGVFFEQDQATQELLRQGAISHMKCVKVVPAPTRLFDAVISLGPELPGGGEETPPDPQVLYDVGHRILEAEDLLELFRERVRELGYAGATEPIELVTVALHSRSLERPIGLAVSGPSAAGKSHTVDTAARFHPARAVHHLTAMSERALAYSEFPTEHAYVVISEASALQHDGVGATIIRGLAWGNELRYETVEKTPLGLKSRVIEKPGPTGLITTTTKSLDPEIATRLIVVEIADTPAQTRAVMRSVAGRYAGEAAVDIDLSEWQAASEWLAIEGERRIVVPFAHALEEGVPDTDVRMRRDLTQVLSVVQALAFMHQQRRVRDPAGRVLAARADYENAYRLLAGTMAVTVDGVSDTIRETVHAVEVLVASDPEGGVRGVALAEKLGLSPSGASRRAKAAMKVGFLVNEEDRRGYPARYRIGEPLPPVRPVLPDPATVFASEVSDSGATRNTSAESSSSTGESGVAPAVEDGGTVESTAHVESTPLATPEEPRDSVTSGEGVEAVRPDQGNDRDVARCERCGRPTPADELCFMCGHLSGWDR